MEFVENGERERERSTHAQCQSAILNCSRWRQWSRGMRPFPSGITLNNLGVILLLPTISLYSILYITLHILQYISCLNIHRTYVTANDSTNNKVAFFLFQI